MSARTPAILCPITHATSAVDAVELGICVADEIASMVNGIHTQSELPLDGLTLTQLKKRMTSINRLALLTVRFADSRSDILGDTRVELQGALDALKAAAPSCWTPVAPDSMPEGFRTVTAWDDSTGFPCTAFFDDEKGCWFAQSDDTRFGEGAITHWLHYVTPTGGNSGGVPA